MFRSLTIAMRGGMHFMRRGPLFVFAVLVCVSKPAGAQEFTDGQQMLREARSAVGARPHSPVTAADEYVVPARYDGGSVELQPAAKPPHDADAKSLSKPLPPRPTTRPAGRDVADGEKTSNLTSPSAATLAGSTCVVLSLFFAVAWLLKRSAPKSMRSLPAAAVEVLGRTPLVRGQHLQLVRCGQRLLLLGVSTNSAQTLAELSEPQEVESLLAACGGSGDRFAPHVANPGVQRDTADRVSELLSSVTGDLRSAALARGARHA